MKYVRKISVLIMAFVLLATIAIGTCVIFSVRNVNVSYIGYSDGETENPLKIKTEVLGRYRGSLMAFVDEEGVRGLLDDGYVLTGFEKKYPCTVNITVKERRETFAVKDGDGYKTYDGDGAFMRRAENFLNPADNSPNLILEGAADDADVKKAAGVCAIFAEEFSSLRSSVETASIIKAVSSVDSDKFVFALRCGIVLEIDDYEVLTREKIAKTFEVFSSLTGEQKLSGAIYGYVTNEGCVRATYNKNA